MSLDDLDESAEEVIIDVDLKTSVKEHENYDTIDDHKHLC